MDSGKLLSFTTRLRLKSQFDVTSAEEDVNNGLTVKQRKTLGILLLLKTVKETTKKTVRNYLDGKLDAVTAPQFEA